jgi:putative FmdB family regulatory protein
MPIREYECTLCQHIQEELELTSDVDEEPVCEVCGGPTAMIAISTSSVHFKGTGWPGADSIKQRQRWFDKN